MSESVQPDVQASASERVKELFVVKLLETTFEGLLMLKWRWRARALAHQIEVLGLEHQLEILEPSQRRAAEVPE